MKLIGLVGRLEEASEYIEFNISGGFECESKSYEFYISESGNNLFVNSNLEKDQLKLVTCLFNSKKDQEAFIKTMSRCGYGL